MDQHAGFTPFLLTPLDFTSPSIYPTFFLCFRSSDPQGCLSHLQKGIDILISRFPLISAQIVSCNGEDGRSRRKKVQMPTSSIRDIPMLSIKHYPNKRLPQHQYRKHEHPHHPQEITSPDQSYCPLPFVADPVVSQPVLRFQANVLADGILLSMIFSHQIADATGGGIILEMLAQSCRASSAENAIFRTNCQIESKLREQLSRIASSPYQCCTHTSDHELLEKESANDTSPTSKSENKSFAPQGLSNRSFVLSPEKVVHLRDICNGLLPMLLHEYHGSQEKLGDESAHRPKFLSSNDVLGALVGFCVQRARFQNGRVLPQSASLAMAVDLRRRLQPPLPDSYIGNAVGAPRIPYHLPREGLGLDKNMFSDLLVELPAVIGEYEILRIADIAFRIRAAVNSTDDKHIRSLISSLNDQDKFDGILSDFPDLWVSSWRNLSAYDLDFGPGIGKIDNFESPPGMADGAFIILPENKNFGGHGRPSPWDVRLTLKTGDMENLARDGLFHWFLDG